jgi:endonuclease III
LREHGKTLCKRKAPLCVACPFEPTCPKTPIKAL